VILALCWCELPAKVCAATHTAASCSSSDISEAIAAASSGDTVMVPAGSVTWTSNLAITKGVTLQGAGADKTIITSNYTPSRVGNTLAERNFLIVYKPAAPEKNEPFRLAGFTLDLAGKGSGIMLKNGTAAVIDKIRVDHNTIKNATHPEASMRAIMVRGNTYGVIDRNTFSGNAKNIDFYGADAVSWDNVSAAFGSAGYMYYEDNTFHIHNTPHSAGGGGKYCARFNTYVFSRNTGLYPWFDMHGNQPNAHHATMAAEIYGNTLTMTHDKGVGLFDQRGGKAMILDNNVITSASVSAKAREEYSDSISPTTNAQPQHVSDSYYWNNRRNGSTLVTAHESEDRCSAIAENSEFYNHNTAFDGTTGIGVGLYANMPSTCKPGVAYWATDKGGNWNTTNGTANDGALYKCTAPNTWTLYYVPYTYPHPLRQTE